MPPTIQWYVRTALLYILVSAALGVWYQLEQWRPVFGAHPYLIVVHVHLALMGGVIQMIMGVALWMFPKPAEGDPRWKPGRFELVYWLFVLGVVGRSTGEIVREYSLARGWNLLVFGASCIEVLAVLVFVVSSVIFCLAASISPLPTSSWICV